MPARSEAHFPWGGLIIGLIIVGVLMMLFRRRTPQYPVMSGPGGPGGPGAPPGYGPQGYGPGYGPAPDNGRLLHRGDGGNDFGANDPGSWDDGGGGGGGGDDWS